MLRDIELGRSNEKMVEVHKGLKEGDHVVLNPQPLLVGEHSKLKAATGSGKRGPMDGSFDGGKKGKGGFGPGGGGAGGQPMPGGNGPGPAIQQPRGGGPGTARKE